MPGPSPWLFVPSPKLLRGDTSESSCSAPDQRDRSRFGDNASLLPGACAELLQPGQWQGQAFIYTHAHTRPRGEMPGDADSALQVTQHKPRPCRARARARVLTADSPHQPNPLSVRLSAVSLVPRRSTGVGSPASASACTVDFCDGAREAAIAWGALARSLWGPAALACPAGCPRWPRGRRLASRWRPPRLDMRDCLVCRQLDNRDVAASSDRGLWANKACFGKAKIKGD